MSGGHGPASAETLPSLVGELFMAMFTGFLFIAAIFHMFEVGDKHSSH